MTIEKANELLELEENIIVSKADNLKTQYKNCDDVFVRENGNKIIALNEDG